MLRFHLRQLYENRLRADGGWSLILYQRLTKPCLQNKPLKTYSIPVTHLLTQSSLMTQRKHLSSLTFLCAKLVALSSTFSLDIKGTVQPIIKKTPTYFSLTCNSIYQSLFWCDFLNVGDINSRDFYLLYSIIELHNIQLVVLKAPRKNTLEKTRNHD